MQVDRAAAEGDLPPGQGVTRHREGQPGAARGWPEAARGGQGQPGQPRQPRAASGSQGSRIGRQGGRRQQGDLRQFLRLGKNPLCLAAYLGN